MLTAWTKHITDKTKQDNFKKEVQGSKRVLDQAVTILKEYETELESGELSSSAYNTPNWDYVQAHNNGLKQGLRLAQKLLNLDQGNK